MKFKPYQQDLPSLFPLNFGDLIPQNDPGRILNQVIDSIELTKIEKTYKQGGCRAYNPKLLLKVIVYAYLRNTYSSRKIEDLVCNDIRFIWLAAGHRPDHNTINNFRSGKLKGALKEIFTQIVMLFVKEQMVTLEKCYTDGTKIEANANKYTFVWGKSIHTRCVKIAEQLNELWQYAEQTCKVELQDKTPLTYQDVSSDKIAGLVDEIDQALQGQDVDPKIKAKVKRAKKNWPEQLKRNEQRAELMGERNSMSKTDPDATFMRMKEDHMGNAQLKPGYNTQISTENGVITNYTIHQTTADTTTYKDHTEEFKTQYGKYPSVSVCDAGYGSEENYLYAKENEIEVYIKYNYFHKENTKAWEMDAFKSSNFFYNSDKDCYYCPMGQQMNYCGEYKRKTKTGFVQTIHRYQATRCQGCPLRCRCHKSKDNRTIEVNHRLNSLKAEARNLLLSEEGIRHRGQRPADVEQAFGNMKWNKKFKRFLLRGIQKVEIEFGLLALAHNMGKYVVKMA